VVTYNESVTAIELISFRFFFISVLLKFVVMLANAVRPLAMAKVLMTNTVATSDSPQFQRRLCVLNYPPRKT
jgi:hypothetical protein